MDLEIRGTVHHFTTADGFTTLSIDGVADVFFASSLEQAVYAAEHFDLTV